MSSPATTVASSGKILWDQFEATAEACRTGGKESERQLGERINELAVAKVLADDKQLRGPITYEPNLLPSKRKIDFVADRLRDNLYRWWRDDPAALIFRHLRLGFWRLLLRGWRHNRGRR